MASSSSYADYLKAKKENQKEAKTSEFYLKWAGSIKSKSISSRILSNLSEIELEDSKNILALAYHLVDKDTSLQISCLRRLKKMRPEAPQVHFLSQNSLLSFFRATTI